MTENKEILPLTEEEIKKAYLKDFSYIPNFDDGFECASIHFKQRLLEEVEKAFIAGFDFTWDNSKPDVEEYMEQLKKTL